MSDLIIPKKYIERLDARTESGEYFFNKNKTVQSPYDRSTTKHFPIGTRWQLSDRVFFYAKAGGNIGSLEHPVINGSIIPDDGFEGAKSGTPLIGDTTITVLDTGSSTTRPKDYYEGGYTHIYSATAGQRQTRRVVKSTVGNTTSITLTLDGALTGDTNGLLTVTTVDVYPSIFRNVKAPEAVATGEESFVGYPRARLQSGEYGWIQTWGPVNGHYNQYFPGDSSGDLKDDRDCVFNQAGEIITLQQMGSFVGKSYQHAGFVIPCTKTNYGSVFILLQIIP
jgi:hypothetical protein